MFGLYVPPLKHGSRGWVHNFVWWSAYLHVPGHSSLTVFLRVLVWMPDNWHEVLLQSPHSDHGLSWHSTALRVIDLVQFRVLRNVEVQVPPHVSLIVLLRKLTWVPWPAVHTFPLQVLHSDHELSSQLAGPLMHFCVFRNIVVHHPPHFSVVILWRVLVCMAEEPHLFAVQALHWDHELSWQFSELLPQKVLKSRGLEMLFPAFCKSYLWVTHIANYLLRTLSQQTNAHC